MASGLTNQPKLSKGALVDIDPRVAPPLIVQFQFNPETLQRRRSIALREPAPRVDHQDQAPADQSIGQAQATLATPETISLDIRLDATDRLEQGDPATRRYGVLPELSALELMAMPRAASPLASLLGLSAEFGFGGQEATPVLVFVWGRSRAYAVRLTELAINETEFSAALDPTRVIASVTLQVLEAGNVYSRFVAAQRLLALQSAVTGRNPVRSLINLS